MKRLACVGKVFLSSLLVCTMILGSSACGKKQAKQENSSVEEVDVTDMIINASDDIAELAEDEDNIDYITDDTYELLGENVYTVLRDDYEAGVLSTDEYVQDCLYVQYQDQELLDDKYRDLEVPAYHHADSLIDEYLDDLSDDTLDYYIHKLFLGDITFDSDEQISNMDFENNNVKTNIQNPFMNTVYADEGDQETSVRNLSLCEVSRNQNFIIWYTSWPGADYCTPEQAERIGDILEDSVEKYDILFNTSFDSNSKYFAKGKTYNQQISILQKRFPEFNAEDLYDNAINIYIVNFTAALAQYNTTDDKIKERVLIKIQDLFDGTPRGISTTPYILVNPSILDDSESEHQFLNHELFHHYEAYLLGGSCEYYAENTFEMEAFANFAGSLITEKTDEYGYYNEHARNWVHAPNCIMGELLHVYGEEPAGYAFYYMLYHYYMEKNDLSLVRNAIFSHQILQYLESNSTQEERVHIMQNAILDGINVDHENKNLDPITYEEPLLNPARTHDADDPSLYYMACGELYPVGVQYIELNPKENCGYALQLMIEDRKTNVGIASYFLGYSEETNQYELIDTYVSTGIPGKTYLFDTNDNIYDRYYVAIANTSYEKINQFRYQVIWNEVEIEDTEEEWTEEHTTEEDIDDSVTEEAYDVTEAPNGDDEIGRLIAQHKLTREDLPESGYISFEADVDDIGMENQLTHYYSTFYYNGNKFTRVVITEVYRNDVDDEDIEFMLSVMNESETSDYKNNGIKNGKTVTMEVKEDNVSFPNEEYDNVDSMIEYLNELGEYSSPWGGGSLKYVNFTPSL
ncbi:MAG: hypothetical protein IJ079_04985 [Lachnospiraceae bacterium]|nr:hypothetical protein [Lachnospiraceae bacterium]